MERGMRSSRRGWRCRRGYVLAEALFLTAVLALAAGLLLPRLSDWLDERRLDLAALEACAVIRTVQEDARSGEVKYPSTSLEYKELSFQMKNGRVRYICRRGIQSAPPTGYLPEGVTVSPVTATLRFMKDSFAGASTDYSFTLYSPRRKFARRVTVAMYTGRVRVEPITL